MSPFIIGEVSVFAPIYFFLFGVLCISYQATRSSQRRRKTQAQKRLHIQSELPSMNVGAMHVESQQFSSIKQASVGDSTSFTLQTASSNTLGSAFSVQRRESSDENMLRRVSEMLQVSGGEIISAVMSNESLEMNTADRNHSVIAPGQDANRPGLEQPPSGCNSRHQLLIWAKRQHTSPQFLPSSSTLHR